MENIKKILLYSANTHDCRYLCAHRPSVALRIWIFFIWIDDLWFIDCHSPNIILKIWKKYIIRKKKNNFKTTLQAMCYEIFYIKKEILTVPGFGVCAGGDLVTELVRSRLVGL